MINTLNSADTFLGELINYCMTVFDDPLFSRNFEFVNFLKLSCFIVNLIRNVFEDSLSQYCILLILLPKFTPSSILNTYVGTWIKYYVYKWIHSII